MIVTDYLISVSMPAVSIYLNIELTDIW